MFLGDGKKISGLAGLLRRREARVVLHEVIVLRRMLEFVAEELLLLLD